MADRAVCRAPDCTDPASQDYGGRWCEPCGWRLRRIAHELQMSKKSPGERPIIGTKGAERDRSAA